MLQFIRERVQGIVAWIIVGLLIIPFALWGINQYFEGGGNAIVANVDGADVTLDEYRDLMARQRDRIRTMLGANATPELIESLVKPKDVLEAVVEREVLVQAANAAGYRVADGLLAEQIRTIEAFQRDGKFSRELYEQYLRSQGQSPSGFEADLRRGVLLDQLNSGVTATAVVTKKEIDDHIRLRDQKREIGYLIVPMARFEAATVPSEDEIKAHYEKDKARYTQPEQISVDYVELKLADLAATVAASEDELKQYYEEHKNEFGVGEERRARHILILEDKAKDPSGEQARKRAQELYDKIAQGESFEELAKKNSEDPGSASQGGDLGFFGRGTMDKAFEDAAFALAKGGVSQPVKSSFGYHIIKLEEIRPGSQKAFADVRNEIDRLVREQKAQTLFFDQSEILANTAYEKPDSLQPVADALNLKVQSSGMFGRRGGPGIASNPKAAAAAFADDVLNKGLNSEPVELSNGHVVVLRMKEHKPEQQRTLDEVRPQVVAAVKRELAGKKAKENGETALKRVESGEDPAAVAKELNVEWKAPVLAARKDAALDRSVVDQVFRLARPVAGKPVTSSVVLGNGDFAIVRLFAVTDGDPAQVDEAQRKSIAQTLADGAAEGEFGAMLEHLKKNARIARFEDKL
jgi:peptidyl-prolyl cis-trans isomerase D